MTILCINCAKADLEKKPVRLSGEIRKHPYTVEMEGLKCPNCGYSTVDGKSMVELGRLAADEYRRANGLLTSDEIVALRERFKESQEAFARRLGIGIASVKRWELGKIQSKHYDDLIREKTKERVTDISQYERAITESYVGSGSSRPLVGSGTFVVANVGMPDSDCLYFTAQNYYEVNGGNNQIIAMQATTSYECSICGGTAGQNDFALIPPTPAPRYRFPIRVGGSHG
jgi:putative zinc finger/helix-turn-helix YgiT family protein